VVVHPGAEEGDLLVGVPVARSERGQVVEHLLLGHAVGQLKRPAQPHAVRDLAREQVV
jgi:hypothetical protein